MSRFNTGNPLGSGDPRDLDDNAKNFDEAINTEGPNWVDRFGRFRMPVMEQERQFLASQEERGSLFQAAQDDREQRFNTFIASSGYQFLGDYAAGLEFTEYNQLVRDENGEFWRLSGQVELPYTTTGAGIPEDDALVPMGDAVLRQDLANPDKGALMVRGAVIYVDTIANLQALDTSGLVDGQVIEVSSEGLFKFSQQDGFYLLSGYPILNEIQATVGIGGDFESLQEALHYYSSRSSRKNEKVTIEIISGHVVSEQITVKEKDLSFITISSQDSEVIVDATDFEQNAKDSSSSRVALFSVSEGGRLPVLGCVFNLQGQNVLGAHCTSGGELYVMPASGIKNGSINCLLHSGGKVYTLSPASGTLWDEENRPVFTGGQDGGLHAYFGSFADATGWDVDNCGGLASILALGSFVNCQRSRARNALGDTAYLSRDASVMNARTSDASGSAGNGYTCFHAAILNARHFDDTGYGGANNCGAFGFSALHGGIIEAEDATALNCGAGAVKAEDGSTVSVKGIRADSNGGRAIQCLTGSNVTCSNGQISGNYEAIFATSNGSVTANDCVIGTNKTSILCIDGGKVSIVSAQVESLTDNGILCQYGGQVYANRATIRGSASSVNCRRGGEVSATESDLRKNGSSTQNTDIVLSDGGVVRAWNSQGGSATAPNQISADGILFKN